MMPQFLDPEAPDEGDDEADYAWDCDLPYPIENDDDEC